MSHGGPEGGGGSGVEVTQANGLAEGLGALVSFIPEITHAVLHMATGDTRQRATNWRHGWKGNKNH